MNFIGWKRIFSHFIKSLSWLLPTAMLAYKITLTLFNRMRFWRWMDYKRTRLRWNNRLVVLMMCSVTMLRRRSDIWKRSEWLLMIWTNCRWFMWQAPKERYFCHICRLSSDSICWRTKWRTHILQGSTCALVESILRKLNVKTGFYSSPHLLNVTERICLNGVPISKPQFSQYFWKIYNTLEEKKVCAKFATNCYAM